MKNFIIFCFILLYLVPAPSFADCLCTGNPPVVPNNCRCDCPTDRPELKCFNAGDSPQCCLNHNGIWDCTVASCAEFL